MRFNSRQLRHLRRCRQIIAVLPLADSNVCTFNMSSKFLICLGFSIPFKQYRFQSTFHKSTFPKFKTERIKCGKFGVVLKIVQIPCACKFSLLLFKHLRRKHQEASPCQRGVGCQSTEEKHRRKSWHRPDLATLHVETSCEVCAQD